MDKRLVKVAQELNVGTATIVEFLGAKGFHIENKPLLLRQFQYSQLQSLLELRSFKVSIRFITFNQVI